MKNILFYLIILYSPSLVAQFYFNANGSGIETYYTTASGYDTFAVGYATTASGARSTAMGFDTVAQDFGTVAIGMFNETNNTPNPTTLSLQNTAFVIGNGGFDNNGFFSGTDETRSNAFKVLFNGTTTIAGNVTAPAFIGDGSQLTNIFSGQFNDLINAPIRSFEANNFIETPYSQSRAPFSVALGAATRTLGEYSFAMGYLSEAVGKNAVAFGEGVIASGTGAVAMGNYSRTNGYGAVALGNGTEARDSGFAAGGGTFAGTEAAALGWNTAAVGGRSFATGEISRAEGWASAAIGYRPEAHGNYSIAMGGLAKTYGEYSIAIGYQAIANSKHSFSLGTHTKTSEYNTFAIGHYNLASREVSAEGSATEYDLDNTAFAIGNGTYNAPSDALVVKFNGNTTIAGNVTAPAFIGDGSQLTNIPFKYNSSGNQGIQSPTNTASGYLSIAMGINTQSSGEYSTTMGSNTTASGPQSTAMGADSTASGRFSTVMGAASTASGRSSTAMGQETTASGPQSTAMGALTIASGNNSTAMGGYTQAKDYASTTIGHYNKIDETPNPSVFDSQNTAFVIGNGTDSNNRSNAFEVLFDGSTTIAGNVTAPAFIGDGSQLTNIPFKYNSLGNQGIQSPTNTASGYLSIAMGAVTNANSNFSTAMGQLTEANGEASTAMGSGTTASGYASTAIGFGSTVDDYSSFAIGSYNKTDETPNPSEFSLLNTAFVIGNGTDDDNRSNAVEVLFDGTTTIAGDLNINSDARLKANIISLGATLSKLLQIDGKTYTMKKDANHKKKIGLLAQDIEKVFPELVTETNDIKSVNYQGLVPVLINAMKEQQDEIDELKALVKQLLEK